MWRLSLRLWFCPSGWITESISVPFSSGENDDIFYQMSCRYLLAQSTVDCPSVLSSTSSCSEASQSLFSLTLTIPQSCSSTASRTAPEKINHLHWMILILYSNTFSHNRTQHLISK
ncbi:unnamed protein product [Pipistrellus nathusii]|uniref:Secreted protein n=1 Tax=Pipistrellus nathusii TaxID=59473 RepID=A0ABP0A0M3_PIPNA